jgi:hypothetical protein
VPVILPEQILSPSARELSEKIIEAKIAAVKTASEAKMENFR